MDKKVLRNLYPRDAGRARVNMTLPLDIDARLRAMVRVGRNGEAAPLVALGLDIVLLVLSFSGDADACDALTELGKRLARVSGSSIAGAKAALVYLRRGVAEGEHEMRNSRSASVIDDHQ